MLDDDLREANKVVTKLKPDQQIALLIAAIIERNPHAPAVAVDMMVAATTTLAKHFSPRRQAEIANRFRDVADRLEHGALERVEN